ncbi:MAG: hypothetical protein Q9160_008582 [Pyrenula sp. 1 TL-2023]
MNNFSENNAMPSSANDFSDMFDFGAAALDDAVEDTNSIFPAERPVLQANPADVMPLPQSEVEVDMAIGTAASQYHGQNHQPTWQWLDDEVAESQTLNLVKASAMDNILQGPALANVNPLSVSETHNAESLGFFEQSPQEPSPTPLKSPSDNAQSHASQSA